MLFPVVTVLEGEGPLLGYPRLNEGGLHRFDHVCARYLHDVMSEMMMLSEGKHIHRRPPYHHICAQYCRTNCTKEVS